MRRNFKAAKGFTLPELLVAMAVIAILAALLLAALSGAKANANRITCMNNLRQINLGIRMYSDDSKDTSPDMGQGQHIWVLYRQQMQSYVGLNGAPSSNDKLFACPSDTFSYVLEGKPWGFVRLPKGCHEQSNFCFSSYEFNGANQATNFHPASVSVLGISGRKLSSIKRPARTVLVLEAAAFIPYSWHQPKVPKPPNSWPAWSEFPTFNNARDVVSYVDGHVGYIKMYWNSSPDQNGYYGLAYFYDPPAEYDYQWSGD